MPGYAPQPSSSVHLVAHVRHVAGQPSPSQSIRPKPAHIPLTCQRLLPPTGTVFSASLLRASARRPPSGAVLASARAGSRAAFGVQPQAIDAQVHGV